MSDSATKYRRILNAIKREVDKVSDVKSGRPIYTLHAHLHVRSTSNIPDDMVKEKPDMDEVKAYIEEGLQKRSKDVLDTLYDHLEGPVINALTLIEHFESRSSQPITQEQIESTKNGLESLLLFKTL